MFIRNKILMFGKGNLRFVLPLSNGAALEFTVENTIFVRFSSINCSNDKN
jgi:hypothetical protein